MHFRAQLAITLCLLSLAPACGGGDSAQGSTSSSSGSGGAGGQAPIPAADPTGWRATGSIAVARSHHTATLLADGRVLVIGGEKTSGAMIDDVEIFDPETETFSTAAPLPEPRANHSATLLDDGRVLIAGGGIDSAIGIPSGEGVLATALLFDVGANTYEPVGDMTAARAGHQAMHLADGRVLLAGGATDEVGTPCTVIPNCATGKALASAEIYDPASKSFTATGDMSSPRLAFAITRLADGRPFVIGGADDTDSVTSTDIFDPASGAFIPTGDLGADRLYLAAATLGSGRVIAACGKKADVSPLKTTEIYDPEAGTWSPTASVDEPRTAAAMATLQSGRVLMVGGYDQIAQKAIKSSLVYDDETGAWTPTADLASARSIATVTLLNDGRALVVGGSSTTKVEISE